MAIVCPSIYCIWVPFWPFYCLYFYLWFLGSLSAIILSVLLFTVSWFPFGHCIVCPSIYVSGFPFGHCIVCPSIYGFCFPLWPLYCVSFYLRFLGSLMAIVLSVLLFTVSEFPFGHCIVCPSIYGFWVPFWSLYCLSFYLRFLGAIRENRNRK
jgi:hypothetical protein